LILPLAKVKKREDIVITHMLFTEYVFPLTEIWKCILEKGSPTLFLESHPPVGFSL
jgi:hypothetical protein